MKLKSEAIAIYIYLVFAYAVVLFCYGFFPLSFSPPTKSTNYDLPSSIDNFKLDPTAYKPRISRAVLMVIDALRIDFTEQKENMPILSRLLTNGSACKYRLQVHPPTVTMPRIKAMTSGAVPSFLDVILNLGSPEMKLDTFIYQMVQQQRKIVFYGDSTWTSMFPDSFIRKGPNVDSLYVNDFYEGDRNITSKMRTEFSKYDWKLMVLHFLGLDHIGHVEGPYSDKVPSKLKEMDEVIGEIHQAMALWTEKFYTKPLLVITGDHGMRDSGGHGGSTHPETYVPLIVVGNDCARSDELFLQIDLAPTFATLMGVAIPHASIGSLIHPMMNRLTPLDRMYAAHYNAKRLIDKANQFYFDTLKEQDFYIQYKEAKLLHTMALQHPEDVSILQKVLDKYSNVSRNLCQLLIKHYIRYDMLCIFISILICISVCVIGISLLLIPQSFSYIDVNISFIQWMLITIIGLYAKFSLQKYNILESELVQNSYISNSLALIIFSVIYLNWSFIVALKRLINLSKLKSIIHYGIAGKIMLFGAVFHTISFASSSFIEEEHQTWLYLSKTLFLLLTVLEFTVMNRTIAEVKQEKSNPIVLRICKRDRSKFCIGSVLFFCGHIILKRWNQTGDKWQHIPDIGDWLITEDNKQWLSLVLAFGLFYLVVTMGKLTGLLTTVLSITACFLVYYYRAMTGVVDLFGIILSRSNSCLTIFWINILEIFFIGFLPKLYRIIRGETCSKSSHMLINLITISALVSALIHKPHNVLLVPALIRTSQHVALRIDHIAVGNQERVILKILAHLWLGKLFYFYQGNSNNLATIDLNAGYVGLNQFDMTRVGLFLTLNTFNGQILAFTMLVYHLLNDASDKQNDTNSAQGDRSLTLRYFLKLQALFVMIPLTFYIIIVTLMRNHIFVWTVFSPKIIYEVFYVALTFLKLAIGYFIL
ncbi:GPI ethanolamine phosphate transferase 2 [Uranotaenia lowii]|uniref:GPI ethanolamine phosphate transferase 2 n=1 Tax=Uranotaenia lowii TaxID=190385 RepID=UPI0024784B4A|nr:GPI ethanolamine phosphate transferase 2 [Uranotaenia lowii]